MLKADIGIKINFRETERTKKMDYLRGVGRVSNFFTFEIMEGTITELFDTFIKSHSDLESAEEAFRAVLKSDPDVQNEYSEWCAVMGYTERKGFSGYYQEYMEHSDSIWDSIFPNKEEYDGYEFDKD